MGRYDKKNGYYPNHRTNQSLKAKLDDTLDVIHFMIGKNIREARMRVLINDVYEHLERYESFHYGISVMAQKLSQLSAKDVVLEHAVPSNVVINKLKSQKPNRSDLLQFFRDHYFLCFITKNENICLNKVGLKFKMPPNWNQNWKNWICRYKAADISLSVNPGL